MSQDRVQPIIAEKKGETPAELLARGERSPGLLRLLSGKVVIDSVRRLDPRSLAANPVMLIVEMTFFITLGMAIDPSAFVAVATVGLRPFYVEVSAILIITVWFSTLSDALAEKQAKSTANSLRKIETEVITKKISSWPFSKKLKFHLISFSL